MTDSQENCSNRRTVLKKFGKGALALPLFTGGTVRSTAEQKQDRLSRSERSLQRPDLFKVWAAEHIEIDYSFTANNPRPVGGDFEDQGAEVGPDGNDRIIEEHIPKVEGTTGFGQNDIWQTDTVYHIRIEDVRTR